MTWFFLGEERIHGWVLTESAWFSVDSRSSWFWFRGIYNAPHSHDLSLRSRTRWVQNYVTTSNYSHLGKSLSTLELNWEPTSSSIQMVSNRTSDPPRGTPLESSNSRLLYLSRNYWRFLRIIFSCSVLGFFHLFLLI